MKGTPFPAIRVMLSGTIVLCQTGPLSAQQVLTPPPNRGPGSVTLLTPGPQPQFTSISGGPAVTTIDWRPSGGTVPIRAMFYSLQRWNASDLTCCNAQWDGLQTNLLFDEGAPWPGKYMYRLTAFYSNGSAGAVDYPHSPPPPVNPASFHGTLANGVVTLNWTAVPNASWYQLSGPQIPNGSIQVAPTSTFFVVRNLPAGTHTWRIGTFYSSQNAPAAVSGPPAQFPVATVIVP
jgi:hypothetical protein